MVAVRGAASPSQVRRTARAPSPAAEKENLAAPPLTVARSAARAASASLGNARSEAMAARRMPTAVPGPAPMAGARRVKAESVGLPARIARPGAADRAAREHASVTDVTSDPAPAGHAERRVLRTASAVEDRVRSTHRGRGSARLLVALTVLRAEARPIVAAARVREARGRASRRRARVRSSVRRVRAGRSAARASASETDVSNRAASFDEGLPLRAFHSRSRIARDARRAAPWSRGIRPRQPRPRLRTCAQQEPEPLVARHSKLVGRAGRLPQPETPSGDHRELALAGDDSVGINKIRQLL